MVEALRASGALEDDHDFRLAMAAADVGAWRWDVGSGLLHLSEAARVLLDLSGGTATYSAFLERVHPDDRAIVSRGLQGSLERAEPCDLDFRTAAVGHPGRWLRLCGRAGPAQDKSAAVRGILIDIARRQAAEEANSRLAAIVASSKDAIVAKTLEGIVTDWNVGAEAIFGYSAEEIIGKPISMLLPPGQEDEEASILERLKRGERIEHFELGVDARTAISSMYRSRYPHCGIMRDG